MAKKVSRRRVLRRVCTQRRLTDLDSEQWAKIGPVLLEALSPHFQAKILASRFTLRDYANALAYLSRYRGRWKFLPCDYPPPDDVYHLNRILRNKRLIPVMRRLLGPNFPFGLEAHYRRPADRFEVCEDGRGSNRRCAPCPRCGEDAMVCYKTRKQGSRIVRYYHCKACGHKRVWLDMPQGKGWIGMIPPGVCG